MEKRTRTTVLIGIACLAAVLSTGAGAIPAAWADAPDTPAVADGDYLIGPGDVLEISVWKDEALTKAVVVRPDGMISFPLIGEILAGGKTTAALRREMEERISVYVPDPDLSIVVQQVNSLIIYVIGRVNNPGRFILNSNVDVLQALAMAGGVNPFAKKNSIKVFRRQGEETVIFKFRYEDVINGENLEQNIPLTGGDVIVVP
jgi:polysaccharide export outer membrane protein